MSTKNVSWFLARDGKEFGPIADDAMQADLAQGMVRPTDLVWRSGFERWETAGVVFAIPSNEHDRPPPLPEAPPATTGVPPANGKPTGKTGAIHTRSQQRSATAGTTTGVVAIVFGVLGLIPPVGIGLALIGLFLGWLARSRAKTVGNATGQKLGGVALILSATSLVIVIAVVTYLGSSIGLLSLPSMLSSRHYMLQPYYGAFVCHDPQTGNKRAYQIGEDFIVTSQSIWRWREKITDVTRVHDGLKVSSEKSEIWVSMKNGKVLIFDRNCDRVPLPTPL